MPECEDDGDWLIGFTFFCEIQAKFSENNQQITGETKYMYNQWIRGIFLHHKRMRSIVPQTTFMWF